MASSPQVIPVVKTASPAAKAILSQATAHWPKRDRSSDGLLPSPAHIKQNPQSDHNTGMAADLTHDPANGVDCVDLFAKLQADPRVLYLIHAGKIWSNKKTTAYKGPNPHNHHLHVSIKKDAANDTSKWFPWAPNPSIVGKAKAKIQQPKPKN